MIKPLRGYLLIEPDKAEETTVSGIVLPETAQEKNGQGKVMAVGKPTMEMVKFGYKDVFEALGIKNGDRVIYKKWSGDDVKDNGQIYKLIKFEDMMGVVE